MMLVNGTTDTTARESKMNDRTDFTDEQMAEMNRQLAEDGYNSVEDWMRDSDYHYSPVAAEWFENGNPHSEPYDPYTQFFWAKEAERESD